jgi:type II secretory pathway component PulL
MQHTNLIITCRYLSVFRTDQSRFSAYRQYPAGFELMPALASLLESFDLTRQNGLNVIIDQPLVQYRYLALPPIKQRKVSKILKFELEDILLEDLDQYAYHYQSRNQPTGTATEVGVYLLPRAILNPLTLFCRERGLDLRWVSPLDNLIDLSTQQERQPGNEIVLLLDEQHVSARLMVYRQGFLIATAIVINEKADVRSEEATSEQQQRPNLSAEFISKLNQQLTLIQLMENDIHGLALVGEAQRFLQVDANGALIPISPLTLSEEAPSIRWADVSKLALNHPRRLNLLHSHQQFLQEIKKNAGAFFTLFSILSLCLLVFLFSIGYRSYHHQQTLDDLTRVYDEAVGHYLPRGTSTVNAISILQEKVNQLQTDQTREQRYNQRQYPVLYNLTQISAIKSRLPSLMLDRFTLVETSIRFGGTVNSIAEFEQLITELRQIYRPETHNIAFNQQHRGGDKIEFSVSIQRLEETIK